MRFSTYELEKLAELRNSAITKDLRSRRQRKQAKCAAKARRVRSVRQTPVALHGASGR